MIYQKRPEYLRETRLLPEDDPLAPHRTNDSNTTTVESHAPLSMGVVGADPVRQQVVPVTKQTFHDLNSVFDRAKSCQTCVHHDMRAGQQMLREREGDLNAQIVRDAGFVIDVPDDGAGKESMLEAARRPWYDPEELGLCKHYGDTLTPQRYMGCPYWKASRGAMASFVGREVMKVLKG
jgi:hypothetical protein